MIVMQQEKTYTTLLRLLMPSLLVLFCQSVHSGINEMEEMCKAQRDGCERDTGAIHPETLEGVGCVLAGPILKALLPWWSSL